MRKLFLTSAACEVLDIFAATFDCDPSQMTLAFIPTAADNYVDKYFVEEDRNKLVQLGFKLFDINIAGQSQEVLQEQLKDVDVIFVAGGNTFYLLEKMLLSGCDTIIKNHIEAGKYYIGSSAGSVVLGTSIAHVKLFDDPKEAPHLTSFDGLGLIDKMILPHYGNEKYQERMNQVLQEYADAQDAIIKFTDDQALVVDGDEMKII